MERYIFFQDAADLHVDFEVRSLRILPVALHESLILSIMQNNLGVHPAHDSIADSRRHVMAFQYDTPVLDEAHPLLPNKERLCCGTRSVRRMRLLLVRQRRRRLQAQDLIHLFGEFRDFELGRAVQSQHQFHGDQKERHRVQFSALHLQSDRQRPPRWTLFHHQSFQSQQARLQLI